MDNLLIKRISSVIGFLMAILVLLCPNSSSATESDPYTYSCIPLEDSSEKINLKLNQIIKEVVSEINISLTKNPKSDVRDLFSYFYFKKMFIDDYGQDAFSVFETCIDTNKCENWPHFERIVVLPKESIYFETNYNRLTKKYLATNIEACGVRFSTDKLTHLLKDGFRFFYVKNNFGITDNDIIRLSKYSEQTIMGIKSTGVYSSSDIVANIKGVEFFEDLLSKHIKKQNGTVRYSDVNICQFINKNYDERVLKNSFIDKKQEINNAIIKRISMCSIGDSNKVLARTFDPISVTNADRGLVGLKNIFSIFNSDSLMLKKIYDNFFPVSSQHEYPIY